MHFFKGLVSRAGLRLSQDNALVQLGHLSSSDILNEKKTQTLILVWELAYILHVKMGECFGVLLQKYCVPPRNLVFNQKTFASYCKSLEKPEIKVRLPPRITCNYECFASEQKFCKRTEKL